MWLRFENPRKDAKSQSLFQRLIVDTMGLYRFAPHVVAF
jgi:hypothetical protein